ncbi:hypothetical protein PLICRDRAFT_40188 [Plicaturopsis crispa FD-325 SS-3]|nr:hypothetical protein PLICRDRAFT_40188 [Plicaturopsis crispa FD-325 SS-3]
MGGRCKAKRQRATLANPRACAELRTSQLISPYPAPSTPQLISTHPSHPLKRNTAGRKRAAGELDTQMAYMGAYTMWAMTQKCRMYKWIPMTDDGDDG